MKITRLYSGPDGESHFDEIELSSTKMDGSAEITEAFKASSVCIKSDGGDCNVSWHNPPSRLLTCVIQGELEIENKDGSKRRFKVGDVFLDEDTTGRGHLTRAVNGKQHALMQVALE